jgi:hypothetical protein
MSADLPRALQVSGVELGLIRVLIRCARHVRPLSSLPPRIPSRHASGALCQVKDLIIWELAAASPDRYGPDVATADS